MRLLFYFILLLQFTSPLFAQKIKSYGVTATETKFEERSVIRVVADTSIKTFDEPTFAKLAGSNFHNGTIEVNVLSKFIPNAPDWARGFIGIAFRINSDNSKFECIYIRPDNGRANDQVRRNHSTQYFSYPDHKFSDFRKTDPEKYESYADMGMNEWIKIKIVVKDARAQLYVDDSKHPCLVVNDLKYGADPSGAIGLWVGNWTEGYFSNLKISNGGATSVSKK
ncbi:MAG: hypothetical protein J7539_13715 [Niabella sp.]|nr:hypothetical protein [Niabella sp.]